MLSGKSPRRKSRRWCSRSFGRKETDGGRGSGSANDQRPKPSHGNQKVGMTDGYKEEYGLSGCVYGKLVGRLGLRDVSQKLCVEEK